VVLAAWGIVLFGYGNAYQQSAVALFFWLSAVMAAPWARVICLPGPCPRRISRRISVRGQRATGSPREAPCRAAGSIAAVPYPSVFRGLPVIARKVKIPGTLY
jgi:hypothetical protein